MAELGSAAASDPSLVDAVAAALAGIRGAKSQAKVSMRAELSRVEITGPEATLAAVRLAEADLGPSAGSPASSCSPWPRTRPS